MTFGSWTVNEIFDLIGILLVPSLLIFLLVGTWWENRKIKLAEQAEEKQFEDDMMRLYGAQKRTGEN